MNTKLTALQIQHILSDHWNLAGRLEVKYFPGSCKSHRWVLFFEGITFFWGEMFTIEETLMEIIDHFTWIRTDSLVQNIDLLAELNRKLGSFKVMEHQIHFKDHILSLTVHPYNRKQFERSCKANNFDYLENLSKHIVMDFPFEAFETPLTDHFQTQIRRLFRR